MPEEEKGDTARPRDTTSALDALVEVACLCGEIVFVTRSGGDRVWECHGCRRRFTVFLQNVPDSTPIAVPMFLDAGDNRGELKLPDPPENMMLLCTCGSPLRITRRLYNHRVQCPHCASRMALLLMFDANQQKYHIHARRIMTASLGDTHMLTRGAV